MLVNVSAACNIGTLFSLVCVLLRSACRQASRPMNRRPCTSLRRTSLARLHVSDLAITTTSGGEDQDSVAWVHDALIAPSQIDDSVLFLLLSLSLHLPVPLIDTTLPWVTSCHAVWRDHTSLGENSDVQCLSELDLAYAPVSSLVLAVAATSMPAAELADNDGVYSLRHLNVPNGSLE